MVLFYFFTRLVQYMHYIYTRKTNNNNKIFGEFKMIEFSNGIFHTVADETKEGVCWIIETATGKMITFVRTQADLDWSINKLMLRREAETGGKIWV